MWNGIKYHVEALTCLDEMQPNVQRHNDLFQPERSWMMIRFQTFQLVLIATFHSLQM